LIFLGAAILLAIERVAYVWVWRNPESFRALCARVSASPQWEPVLVLERLFYIFKGIQAGVFLGWCYWFSGSILPDPPSLLQVAAGTTLIVAGQILNFGVFYRLGSVGVFYGNRFGYDLEWKSEFPFSILAHPQYVGALISIWGFFFAMRFPNGDWFLIPLLETVYYVIGTYLER